MIELKNVEKVYSKKQVIKNINLRIEPNTIIGLVGENGAGKSTIMKIITGIIKRYSGERIVDENIKIGSLIEGPSFYKKYDAKTNLRYLGAYKDASSQDIDYVYNLLKLNEFGKKAYGKYSLGMKQRLGIALALLGKPSVLILDEPFNGLDPKQVIDIVSILKEWMKETQGSIMISSHILSQLDMLCDKVIFINKGTINKEVKIDKSTENSIIYRIILTDKDESCYEFLKNNNIEILENIDMKSYKIKIEPKGKIIREVCKNFSIEEVYKEKQTIESIFRKVEGIDNEYN